MNKHCDKNSRNKPFKKAVDNVAIRLKDNE